MNALRLPVSMGEHVKISSTVTSATVLMAPRELTVSLTSTNASVTRAVTEQSAEMVSMSIPVIVYLDTQVDIVKPT